MAITTVPDIKLGQNGSDNLNSKQIAVINENDADLQAELTAAKATDRLITAASVDNENTTATLTIAVTDGAGTALTDEFAYVQVWLAATAGSTTVTAADTSMTATTGAVKATLTAAGDVEYVTDDTGALVLTISNADTANDLFAMVRLGGKIVTQEITITTI